MKDTEFTSLKFQISELQPDSLPGYEGDMRLNWRIEIHDSLNAAIDRTFESLVLLREFWDASTKESSKDIPKSHAHILPVGGISSCF
jgi:hypothetical protein